MTGILHFYSIEKRTGSTYTDQHHVASGVPDDPGYLDEVDDGIRKEDEVHVGASDDVVVLVQEVFQALLQGPGVQVIKLHCFISNDHDE
jgi:hypothetical protein